MQDNVPARVFTTEELSQYDGKYGSPAYVAYNGLVYDVTESFMWEEGTHELEHEAGIDLTEAMELAPHGEDVMDTFPVVGTFEA